MKRFLVSFLLLTSTSFAETVTAEHHRITSIETTATPMTTKDFLYEMPQINPGIGAIISIGSELVALGQELYSLVEKGRPSITTEFAPINVLPKDPATRSYVDPFDLEETSDPIITKYVMSAKNSFKQTVVRFEYIVIFEVGKYGSGRYIQNAMIVPRNIRVLYGFTLESQMKLMGVSNKGTRAAPVAGARLNLTYKMNSLVSAMQGNDSFTIDARGKTVLHR